MLIELKKRTYAERNCRKRLTRDGISTAKKQARIKPIHETRLFSSPCHVYQQSV